jgi:hypothetical protein
MKTITFHPRSGRRRVTPLAVELWIELLDRIEDGQDWREYGPTEQALINELGLSNGAMISPHDTVADEPGHHRWNPRAQEDWAAALAARKELERMSGRRAPRPEE